MYMCGEGLIRSGATKREKCLRETAVKLFVQVFYLTIQIKPARRQRLLTRTLPKLIFEYFASLNLKHFPKPTLRYSF